MKKDTKFIPALRLDWLTKAFDPFLTLTLPERKMKRDLLLQTQIKEGENILDFGCGTGTLVVMIKELFEGVNVFGVDIDPKILEIARKKQEDAGYKINFEEYDGTALPYEANTFDKVFSSLVFHHLGTIQKTNALKEIFRVLKNGGEINILDFGKPANFFMRILFLIPGFLDGLENTKDNVKGLLPTFIRDAGFTGVVETRQVMTVFGSISFYKARKVV